MPNLIVFMLVAHTGSPLRVPKWAKPACTAAARLPPSRCAASLLSLLRPGPAPKQRDLDVIMRKLNSFVNYEKDEFLPFRLNKILSKT